MITIIGSLNYDLVTYTDKVPDAGETYAATAFENHLGGKGLNEALATARLTEKPSNSVRMVGNIGDDAFGSELKQALVDAHVDTQFVTTIPGEKSGVAVILVENSGENRILITAGANGHLKPTEAEYQRIFADSSPGDYVIVQNEYPCPVELIEWVKTNKPQVNIAYNPSPYKRELITPELMLQIDLLIVNEGEAQDVAATVLGKSELELFSATIAKDAVEGFSQLAATLQRMLDQRNVSSVVVTMGSKGSVLVSKKDAAKFEPAVKVSHVVDTTGAGDTFFGGVVLQLSAGTNLEQATVFATSASSLAIQKKGAAEGIPWYAEVAALAKL